MNIVLAEQFGERGKDGDSLRWLDLGPLFYTSSLYRPLLKEGGWTPLLYVGRSGSHLYLDSESRCRFLLPLSSTPCHRRLVSCGLTEGDWSGY